MQVGLHDNERGYEGMKQGIKKLLLKYCGFLILTIMQISTFAILWLTYYVPILDYIDRNFYFWGHWAVVGMYFIFVIFFTHNFDGYGVDFQRAKNTCFTHCLAMICANMLSILQSWIIGRYYFSVIPIILLTIFQILFIIAWSFVLRFLYLRVNEPSKILVVHGLYPPNAFETFLEKTDLYNEKFYLMTLFDLKKEEEELWYKIKDSDEVLLYDISTEKRNDILKYCYSNSKKVYITPKISDIIISGAERVYLSDSPLLRINRKGLRIETLLVKRMVDIIVSLVGIIIMSPFLLVSAIIIKSYDGGKVFFTQKRLTRNEKPFEIIKFRSMREDSEVNGPQIARYNDDRITPYGRFLRSTHLDELPQLFNILKGDMTLVGPRPERIENIEEYEKIIPEFKYRLSVKAGLTGYAQIYGKYDTTPYDKVKLDLEYIEKHSLFLDLKLMILTFKVMFQKGNAEGVKKQQRSALLDMNFMDKGKECEGGEGDIKSN